jgi:hypothetical protein
MAAELKTEMKPVVKGSLGYKLSQVIKFVEEEALGKRVVVSFDSEWANSFARYMQQKHPELEDYSVAQVKGALKYLLKDITAEAIAREGFVATTAQ